MQAMLMNFGDATRIIRDVRDNPLVIDTGQVVDADIHEAHYHVIKNGVRTDTLMLVPEGIEISERLQSMVDLLRVIETEEYDDLLRRFNTIVPYDEDNSLRPSRYGMMVALRDLARYEVSQVLHANRVFIKEQGDETTRKEPPPAESKVEEPKEKEPEDPKSSGKKKSR